MHVDEISVDSELVAEILHQARTTSGERGHNVGGWRSSEQFATWPRAHHTLTQIARLILPSPSQTRTREDSRPDATRATLHAWAVVHENGSYHDWHAHTGVDWRCSGVLYLTTGGAATLFRGGAASLRVAPRAGMLLTFPAIVEHATEPHDELEPRVTIAFNAS